MKTFKNVSTTIILLGLVNLSCAISPDSVSESNGLSMEVNPTGDTPSSLASHFLKALREDNLIDYQACWLGPERVMLDGEERLFDEPRRDFVAKYIAQRDEVVKVTFPILRRALIDQAGSIDSLSLSGVQLNSPFRHDTSQKVGGITVLMSVNGGRTLSYRIDDGARIEGAWFFTDKPSFELVISEREKKDIKIALSDYATKEELEQLANLGLS